MIYVKRLKTCKSTVAFYRGIKTYLVGWCGEMMYDKWRRITGIELEPGEYRKVDFRIIDNG